MQLSPNRDVTPITELGGKRMIRKISGTLDAGA